MRAIELYDDIIIDGCTRRAVPNLQGAGLHRSYASSKGGVGARPSTAGASFKTSAAAPDQAPEDAVPRVSEGAPRVSDGANDGGGSGGGGGSNSLHSFVPATVPRFFAALQVNKKDFVLEDIVVLK